MNVKERISSIFNRNIFAHIVECCRVTSLASCYQSYLPLISWVFLLQVAFHLPAKIENMPHREPVLKIRDTQDGTFVACSQDGLVTFWTGNIELKRTKTVIVSELCLA